MTREERETEAKRLLAEGRELVSKAWELLREDADEDEMVCWYWRRMKEEEEQEEGKTL